MKVHFLERLSSYSPMVLGISKAKRILILSNPKKSNYYNFGVELNVTRDLIEGWSNISYGTLFGRIEVILSSYG